MREAGLTVNGTPKIHIKEPTLLDHAIICDESDLHIRLHLHGIVSCFKTRAPTNSKILDPDSTVVLLSPEGTSWDPQSDIHRLNEESYVDYYGNLVPM